MLMFTNAECRDKGRLAECRYDECRGAVGSFDNVDVVVAVTIRVDSAVVAQNRWKWEQTRLRFAKNT